MGTYAAVVLAGGAARRMGGVDKPALPVGGRPMRDRVLTAVTDATPRVLVGAADAVPAGVLVVREDPPGGGPVAAAAAGLALLDPDAGLVALLAADLPLLTRAAIGDLLNHLDEENVDTEPAGGGSAPASPAHSGLAPAHGGFASPARSGPGDGERRPDGVCFVDGDGRRQSLCGVWRVAALRAAVDRLTVERGGSLAGAPVRALLAGLVVREVAWSGEGPPPWFDCDTDEDVRRAEEWAR
ncbi:molybdopterin-guanine dinucleotide biosynthesis protein A [Micromonospora vinacea]|uniref:Molybdopterin-guanine dinucleotide biosynthesis protein A n=2 Tax=Micromonospora vinacea TaxID=709878 RepID=A0ABS0JYK5_9ACTN|nr:NTP transferase domain-containing protein [Micromonospora vinacea]MBG6101350.1 molybdopterin-guanine dinucleotide biosynthesis protein A [Micromonospora vinacea]